MSLSGPVLLIGDLHFINAEWAQMASAQGVTELKVSQHFPLYELHARIILIRLGISHGLSRRIHPEAG